MGFHKRKRRKKKKKLIERFSKKYLTIRDIEKIVKILSMKDKKRQKRKKIKEQIERFGKKYLTPKDIGKIIKILSMKDKKRYKRKKIKEWIDYVLFANDTGVRIKEYSHLKWEDIDLVSGIGNIKREYTKSDAGVRPIYIQDEKLL